MSVKTTTFSPGTCLRCGGDDGPEIQAGDAVKVFLDQVRVPGFPEYIEGIVTYTSQASATDTTRTYGVQYESDDLNGAATALAACDILSILCVSCCELISDYLTLLDSIDVPHVDLWYKWVGTELTLQAVAHSTRVAGIPGAPVTIVSYEFNDPAGAVLAGGIDPDIRTFTPVDAGFDDWPGGHYAVTVTDSEGLINSATVWVAPRPRFRRTQVTAALGASTATVTLAAGEVIISAIPDRAGEGVVIYGPTVSGGGILQLSAPVAAALNINVLIHTP